MLSDLACRGKADAQTYHIGDDRAAARASRAGAHLADALGVSLLHLRLKLVLLVVALSTHDLRLRCAGQPELLSLRLSTDDLALRFKTSFFVLGGAFFYLDLALGANDVSLHLGFSGTDI